MLNRPKTKAISTAIIVLFMSSALFVTEFKSGRVVSALRLLSQFAAIPSGNDPFRVAASRLRLPQSLEP
jgi:hypothetical protein